MLTEPAYHIPQQADGVYDPKRELNECSLSEQFDILSTLKRFSSKELQPIQAFTRKFSTDGFRTILSLRFEGDSFSKVILQFAQENPEQARVVFASYSELLNRLDDISKVIKREVRCEGADCEELIRASEERLFHKTHLYLKKAIAEQNTASINKIGDSAAAGVVLSASLQAALESGAVSSVRELEGFRQDVISGPDLMQDTEFVDRLKEIYRYYYQHYKDGGASLIEQFEQRLASQDTKVHLWRIGDEVLAFALATEQPDSGEVYVSALNVNPALKEAKAGVGLVYEMDQYLEDGKCVVAEATVDNAAGYCKFGYVITDWIKDPDEGFVFKVRKQSDWHFSSQQEKPLHFAKYEKKITYTRTQEVFPTSESGHPHLLWIRSYNNCCSASILSIAQTFCLDAGITATSSYIFCVSSPARLTLMSTFSCLSSLPAPLKPNKRY